MAVALLIAGIGFLLAGLLAIAVGIPVKEFSFGNTMILAGVVGACSGAVMLSVWTVIRKLDEVVQRIAGLGLSGIAPSPPVIPLPLPATVEAPRDRAAAPEVFNAGRDQPGTANADVPAPSPPWHEDAAPRNRARDEASPPEAAPAPVVKQRRNLLFSSSVRKDRDRAEMRVTDPAVVDPRPTPPVAPPPAKPDAATPAEFDTAWPQSQRTRAAESQPRRHVRAPSTFADDAAADRRPFPPPQAEPPAVTVLKSGVVDGMAYSLYSDGSIEAQMPEGMMRFASIDELRTHLEQRT